VEIFGVKSKVVDYYDNVTYFETTEFACKPFALIVIVLKFAEVFTTGYSSNSPHAVVSVKTLIAKFN